MVDALFRHSFAPDSGFHAIMVRKIESGDLLQAAMITFRECDKDGNGRLTWNNGEIRNFITACFKQHNCTPPNEEHLFALYSTFDKDRNNVLDRTECLEMVDAIFRQSFALAPPPSPVSRQVRQEIQQEVVMESMTASQFQEGFH